MQRVSVKTLVLMLLLLVAVITQQHIRCVPVASASARWVADDPNDPGDPGPENSLRDTQRIWLDVAPQDANDPDEPMPETAGWMPTHASPADDPNDPGDPGPEYV
jgi:hypothetical protein